MAQMKRKRASKRQATKHSRIPSGKVPVERAIEAGRRIDDFLGVFPANAFLPRSKPELTSWALSMSLGMGNVGDKGPGELAELGVGVERKSKSTGDVKHLLGEARLMTG